MESVFVATEIHNIYQVQCMFVGEFATELCQHIVTIAVCHTWTGPHCPIVSTFQLAQLVIWLESWIASIFQVDSEELTRFFLFIGDGESWNCLGLGR